jgi:hypothetical protein
MTRYFRLMALAMSEIIFTTPLAIFTMYLNTALSPIGPWISWADTHYEYFRVRQIPAILWRSDRTHVIALEFTRWVAPLCALLFFAFFGFAHEARKNYSRLFFWIFRPFGSQSQGEKLRSTKDTASIGFALLLRDVLAHFYYYSFRQFSVPKTPMSAKSSNSPSSILPTYSPPASFYPVLDIKQPDSTVPTNEYDRLRFSSTDKTNSELGFDALLVDSYVRLPDHPSQKHISWKAIPVPPSDRRHSSYF